MYFREASHPKSLVNTSPEDQTAGKPISEVQQIAIIKVSNGFPWKE